MVKKRKVILWIFFGLALFNIGCTPESDKLNSTEERTVRRLVRKQQDSIRIKQDSLCNLEIQSRLDGMVDSLLKVKIEDLKTKMGKR